MTTTTSNASEVDLCAFFGDVGLALSSRVVPAQQKRMTPRTIAVTSFALGSILGNVVLVVLSVIALSQAFDNNLPFLLVLIASILGGLGHPISASYAARHQKHPTRTLVLLLALFVMFVLAYLGVIVICPNTFVVAREIAIVALGACSFTTLTTVGAVCVTFYATVDEAVSTTGAPPPPICLSTATLLPETKQLACV